MKKILLTLDDEEEKVLKKRAKKNMMSLKDQVADIIRRSCVSSKRRSSQPKDKVDDKLVKIFSRTRRGRPKKKKKK